MRNPAHAAFAALGLIWGSNFLFMKWAAATITPGQTTLLRVLFGFVPVALYAASRGALSRSHLRHLHHFAVMSLLATSVYYVAFASGAALLPSGIAGALSGAIPLFSLIAAATFLRDERATPRRVLGVLVGLGGVLLIARPWSASGVSTDGVLFMLLGSASVGLSFVRQAVPRRPRDPGGRPDDVPDGACPPDPHRRDRPRRDHRDRRRPEGARRPGRRARPARDRPRLHPLLRDRRPARGGRGVERDLRAAGHRARDRLAARRRAAGGRRRRRGAADRRRRPAQRGNPPRQAGNQSGTELARRPTRAALEPRLARAVRDEPTVGRTDVLDDRPPPRGHVRLEAVADLGDRGSAYRRVADALPRWELRRAARVVIATAAAAVAPGARSSWAASIRHIPLDDERHELRYTLTFRCRPRLLAPLIERVALAAFRWETRRRLRALARALA